MWVRPRSHQSDSEDQVMQQGVKNQATASPSSDDKGGGEDTYISSMVTEGTSFQLLPCEGNHV